MLGRFSSGQKSAGKKSEPRKFVKVRQPINDPLQRRGPHSWKEKRWGKGQKKNRRKKEALQKEAKKRLSGNWGQDDFKPEDEKLASSWGDQFPVRKKKLLVRREKENRPTGKEKKKK